MDIRKYCELRVASFFSGADDSILANLKTAFCFCLNQPSHYFPTHTFFKIDNICAVEILSGVLVVSIYQEAILLGI